MATNTKDIELNLDSIQFFSGLQTATKIQNFQKQSKNVKQKRNHSKIK